MSNTYNVDEEFIKEAHEAACSDWKKKLENKFPTVFPKIILEKGKWYKLPVKLGFYFKNDYILIMFNDKEGEDQIGFDADGNWSEKLGLGNKSGAVVAPEDLVKQHLKEEAKKRGLVKGAKIEQPDPFGGRTFIGTLDTPKFYYFSMTEITGNYNMALCNTGGVIYYQGVWGKLIEDETPETEDTSDPTEEEIERVLNYLKEKSKQ